MIDALIHIKMVKKGLKESKVTVYINKVYLPSQ